MINKQTIEKTVSEVSLIEGLFVVDVDVKRDNSIIVLIDSIIGVTIDDCKKVSRIIEQSLDRETQDFSLQVSSPGLDKPFKVKQQYLKNINRDVETVLLNGEKFSGKMIAVTDDNITIEFSEKVKIKGKKPKKVIKTETISFKDIKSTKVKISFK